MTLDEARLLANVNARAQTLFELGYRARWNVQIAKRSNICAEGVSYLKVDNGVDIRADNGETSHCPPRCPALSDDAASFLPPNFACN